MCKTTIHNKRIVVHAIVGWRFEAIDSLFHSFVHFNFQKKYKKAITAATITTEFAAVLSTDRLVLSRKKYECEKDILSKWKKKQQQKRTHTKKNPSNYCYIKLITYSATVAWTVSRFSSLSLAAITIVFSCLIFRVPLYICSQYFKEQCTDTE